MAHDRDGLTDLHFSLKNLRRRLSLRERQDLDRNFIALGIGGPIDRTGGASPQVGSKLVAAQIKTIEKMSGFGSGRAAVAQDSSADFGQKVVGGLSLCHAGVVWDEKLNVPHKRKEPGQSCLGMFWGGAFGRALLGLY